MKKEDGYGSILAARGLGSRDWHRWCDCVDEREEEENAVTGGPTSEWPGKIAFGCNLLPKV